MRCQTHHLAGLKGDELEKYISYDNIHTQLMPRLKLLFREDANTGEDRILH